MSAYKKIIVAIDINADYAFVIDYKGMIVTAKEQLADIAKKYGIAQTNLHVKGGHPAEEIRSIANKEEADLIVIGTHGRSGIQLLLGSTATALLHDVQQDVLAVRMHAVYQPSTGKLVYWFPR